MIRAETISAIAVECLLDVAITTTAEVEFYDNLETFC